MGPVATEAGEAGGGGSGFDISLMSRTDNRWIVGIKQRDADEPSGASVSVNPSPRRVRSACPELVKRYPRRSEIPRSMIDAQSEAQQKNLRKLRGLKHLQAAAI